MKKPDDAGLCSLAETLGKYGLYRCALRMLDGRPDLYGQRANSLRRRLRRNATAQWIPAGIYLLAVAEEGPCACVVPVRAERGDCRASVGSCGWRENTTEQAFLGALDLARGAILSSSGLPCLRLVLPEGVFLFGESCGLPAFLAFVEKWSGKRPEIPVLATGRVDGAGNVLAVQDLTEKIDAALGELAGSPGLVLIPKAQAGEAVQWSDDRLRPVRTVEEAAREVWSDYPLAADRSLLTLEATLQEARGAQDPRQSLRILESHQTEGLARADLARLLFEIGCQYRHLGQSEEAARLHEKARALLAGNEGAIGSQAVETLEMEAFATEMDLFALAGLERDLRARLKRPFLADHNRVRCQGMLAQLLSTAGRHEEAVRLRQSNLAIQGASETMRREMARTLACLAYEAARGGMADLFEKTVLDLFDKTEPGDTLQARYNLCAVARGLVLLGRHSDLLDWGRDRARLYGQSPDPHLVRLLAGGTGRMGLTHPEVSTLRAVVRALRKTRELPMAIALASSLDLDIPRKGDLIYWLGVLVEVERALAFNDADQKDEARATLASAAEKLKSSHPQAAQYYSTLLTEVGKVALDGPSVKKVELELDRVYY